MSSVLVFFKSGRSEDFKKFLRDWMGEVRVYPLANVTSDGLYLHELVREAGAKMVSFDEALGVGERYAHLDDYVRVLNEWSLHPSSKTGLNLRQSLAFSSEVSAWWFLAFTEKGTASEPVEIFKAIHVLSSSEARAGKISFWGAAADGIPFRHLGKSWGADFSVVSPASTPVTDSLSRNVGNRKVDRFSTLLKGFFFDLTLSFRRRPKIDSSLVFLSDYPKAWAESERAPADRYLQNVRNTIEKEYPGRVLWGLQVERGPLFFPGTLERVREAEEFAKRVSSSDRNSFTDVVDLDRRTTSFLRSKLWARSMLRKIRPQLASRDFGLISYRGIDLTDYFSNLILSSLENRIPDLLAQGIDLARFLRKSHAKVCFYRNEYYCLGRVYSWACARAGVSSFAIQHGIINQKYGVYRFHESEIQRDFFHQDLISAMPSPMRFGLWGKWYRNQILAGSSGYPEKALPIIGSERMIDLAKRAIAPRATSKEGLVLFFTAQDARTLEAVEILFGGLAKYSETRKFELRIKLHPFHPHPVREVIERFSENNSKLKPTFVEGDLARWIAESDVVLTAYSASGIEALLCGRPLITIQVPTIAGDSSYGNFSSWAYEVSDANSFLRALFSIEERTLNAGSVDLPYDSRQEVLALDPAENQRVLVEVTKSLLRLH